MLAFLRPQPLKRAVLLTLLLINSQAFAGFEDGVDAFNRGDYVNAARHWRPLAESGDADAARNLGRLYHEGLGVGIDYLQARHWYSQAAAKCNASAQNNLGLLLQNGQGGEKDLVAAFRLFQKAAIQGLPEDADAMGNLANMYWIGEGTQPNVVESYKWLLLFRDHATDLKKRERVTALIARADSHVTPIQRTEALKRANRFVKVPCVR